MAVNAYSRGPVAPGFSNPYVSQYVEAPLGYIGAALQQRQATYDHYLEGEQTLQQGLMGIQAATPSDAAYLKKVQATYNKQLSDLADTDLTRPENQRALKEIGTQLATDRTLQGIQATHARMGELQAQARKLQAEGKYHASQATLNRIALERYEAQGGAGSGASLDAEDFTPEQDARKKADDYFTALHGDEQEGLGFLDVGEDGKVAYSSKHGGIGAGKVNQTVIGAASDWLQSQEGRQVIKDGLAQGMSPRQAAQYSLNFLRNRGQAHVYSTSSSNLDVAFNKVGDLKRAKKKEKEAKTPAVGSFTLPDAKTSHTLNLEFGEDGNVKGDGVADFTKAWDHIKNGEVSKAWSSVWNDSITPEQEAKLKPLIQGTARANQEIEAHNSRLKAGEKPLPKLTPKEYAENYTGLTKNTNSTIQYFKSGKDVKDASEAFMDNNGVGIFSAANVRILGPDQSPQVMSGADAYKQITGAKLSPSSVNENGGLRISGPVQVTEEGYEQPAMVGDVPVMIQFKSGQELSSPSLHTIKESLEYNQKVAEKTGYHTFEAFDGKKVRKIRAFRSPISGQVQYENAD